MSSTVRIRPFGYLPNHPVHGARHWVHDHAHLVHQYLVVFLVSANIFVMLNLLLAGVQINHLAPFTNINGQSFGLMPTTEAKQLLEQQFKEVNINVKVQGKSLTLNAKDSGVTVDADQTLSAASQKSGWDAIPVAHLLGNLFTTNNLVFKIDEAKLAQKLNPYITDESKPSRNAVINVPADLNQPVVVQAEVNGFELNAKVAAQEVASSVRRNEFTVKVVGQVVLPKWTREKVASFMPTIENARHTSVSIQTDKNKLELPAAKLAELLRLDQDGKKLAVTLDKPALVAWLEGQSNVFYIAPVATKTVLKDGVEISRVEGAPGRKLDAQTTAGLVITALKNGTAQVEPDLADVTPAVVAKHTYSNTSAGLYKMIEDFAKSHGGSYRVAAVELDSAQPRSAFYAADASIITASTYKLFVSYAIMQRIQAGTLTMSSNTSQGSVEYCMHQMIIVSSNECAKAFQDILGWPELDKKLKADGFGSTTLNNYSGGDKHTTARDEMKLLTAIYFHELVNQDSANYIFNLMEHQIYRNAIPAASRGSLVADKPGMLYGLYHDIAIVFGKNRTYAVVILTDGAGGYNVRSLAQQIYDFYNQ